ncbi:MAG: response regulator transcription factor, partial [Paracoccaceae bacterium]|nr:response regulator transcription factor [Paracoccaceae bacterium]
MRILIADDHAMVRETIAMYLAEGNGAVVDQVENLEEALEHIRSSEGYDLVLLDLMMPGMNGLKGLVKTIDINGGRAVAILSGVQSNRIARDAIDIGARGFITKSLPARSLINAIKFIVAGEVYFPPSLMEMEEGGEGNSDPVEKFKLTTQEAKVLPKLAVGMTNKEIANQ